MAFSKLFQFSKYLKAEAYLNPAEYFKRLSTEDRQAVTSEFQIILSNPTPWLEAFGMEANLWFADASEATQWIQDQVDMLNRAAPSDGTQSVTKDSNGTTLNEGDSVTVIKDLKVKGGSSDLKRGTLVKKIHLIAGDSENIECNVQGSTLVLKTQFLKKA